ncbi:MAG TPA: DUF4097 family beta strand repeat-containing protein [Vicinamibacterales bacterium]|nr:DUF4097 family beta strand repeat-containing protein [Vicinamibacterales bacterium]
MDSALSPKPLALLAGLGVMVGLAACDVTIKDGDIKNVSMHAKVTQEWSRHYPLAAGGRVEILNPDGPIEAVVGPAGSVDVAVVIDAGAVTEARAKEVLTEFKMEESATPDHVRVATARTRGRRGMGDADISYKVTLPADAHLQMTGNNGTYKASGMRGHVKAMVVNGGIELTDLRGGVDAAAVNGHVSVKMAEITNPMRLEATNGRLTLEIPKAAKATLNARSVNGGITITGLNTDEGTGRRIRTLESQLNGGGPEIDMRVTNGRINITGIDPDQKSQKSRESLQNRESPPSPPVPPRPPKPDR